MFVIVICLILVCMIVYMIYNKYIKCQSNIIEKDHCIIIGGSISGMITAAYLSKYFKRITIIESDDILNDQLMKSTSNEILDYRCHLQSPKSLGRSSVGQIYQLHVIESEGYQILRELFPQFENKLFNEYNIRSYSLTNESRFTVNGVLLNQNLTEDIQWLGADRFTLETLLRREFILQFGNQIQWKTNSRVQQLIVDQRLNIVKGVKYRSKENDHLQIFGDFIIDCSGRNSSSSKWLKESFNLIIPNEEIHFGCGYLTFVGERFETGDSTLDSLPIICTTVNSPYQNTGCYITPIRQLENKTENSLGTLSTIAIHCVNGEYPPNDSYENLLDWIKQNLHPQFYSILKSTKVYGPLIPFRHIIDSRKYTELLGKQWPRNYILLGDAMCTFNPQLGQGMTHACKQAKLLNQIFKQYYHHFKDISHIFNSRASKISEECWLLSTANDWKTPTLKVIQTDRNGQTKISQRVENSSSTKSQLRPPLMIRIFHWYQFWFLQCAFKSGQLSTDFNQVINQHKSLFILMKPKTFLTICYTAIINHFNHQNNHSN